MFIKNKLSLALSIVMPIYNVNEQYLQDSLSSILEQTFQEFELIIVDDGSTDLSGLNFVKSLSDSRIHIIHNKHNFIDSLNKGIRVAQGKYIVRMDADDIMLSERLEEQFQFMEQNPDVDVCGSWIELFEKKTGVLQAVEKHSDIQRALLLYNAMAHPSIIFKRSIADSIYPGLYNPDYLYVEDYKLWTDLIKKGFRFANIQKVLMKYRVSDNQVTHTKYQEMREKSVKIQWEYVHFLIEEIEKKEGCYKEFFKELRVKTKNNKLNFSSCINIIDEIYNETCCKK